MPWGYAAVAAASIYSADQQSSAAKSSADRIADASSQSTGIAGEQFDATQALLAPYVSGGRRALDAQQDLLGLRGDRREQRAIDDIRSGPEFTSLLQQGESSILQNASATGGLRGGDTQGALAQFSPQLLSGLVNQRFQQLGGLAQQGQASAAGVGAAGQNFASQAGANLQNTAAAQAGSGIAQGKANADLSAQLAGLLQQYQTGQGGGF